MSVATASDPTSSASKRRSRRPIAVDLFSGAGGLALGFEQAGFDVVTAVEYDPVHAATHEFNSPHTEVLCADLSKLSAARLREAISWGLDSHEIEDWDGDVDAVIGGPPCQGFSTMGKRLIDDKRNELVFHFFRVVSELRPRYFVMENVPGMRAGGHSSILNRLIEEFEQIGYWMPPPKILNAADYGVPQDRRRLFLIGTRNGEAVAQHPMPHVSPVAKRPGAKLRPTDSTLPPGPTVGDALGDLPDLDDFEGLVSSDRVVLPNVHVARQERLISNYVARLRGADSDDLSYRRRWDARELTSSARTAHTDLSISRFRATVPGDTEPISRFYRLHPAGLCNTLRAGTGSERGAFTSPRPIHPSLPRVLSVREAARLHSFPDWFQLHATKWHGFRQIGNAVAPLVGRAVGQEIVSALELRPERPSALIELGDRELLSLRMEQAAAYFGADRADIPAPRVRMAGVGA